jgi:maltose O-acetyltransferase
LVRVSDRHDCLAGPVVIGDDVWIAHGATIEPGVTVGSGSVVAAGSVVSCDVPPGSLAIGNPARCMSLSLRSHEPRGAEPTGPANAADAG